MFLRPRFFLHASLLALSACSSAGAAPSGPAPQASSDAGPPPADASAPETEACANERASLQTRLDKAHKETTGAILAVKTPSCGLRVLTSAPEKLALTADKLHRIGSITKTYVAALVLELVDDKLLSLDDSVAKLLPQSGVPGAGAITVKHLLNHTSGIPNYTNTADFTKVASEKPRHVTPEELVAMAAKEPPDFEPGAGWRYSNTNYIVLGMIAEKVGGAKLGVLVRSRVLDKVGLAETYFDSEEPVVGEIATGLGPGGDDLTKAYDLSIAWAAGAMVASPRDIVTWIEALGSGAFHDADTQAAMLVPATTDNKSLQYGLGVFLYNASITAGMGPGIGHGGDIPGYHSEAVYFPDTKTTIVGVADSDRDAANPLIVAALDVLAAGRK